MGVNGVAAYRHRLLTAEIGVMILWLKGVEKQQLLEAAFI